MRRYGEDVVDALQAQIAILDGGGVIVAVNAAWRRSADEHHARMTAAGVGRNYLTECDRAAEDGVEDAAAMARGIRDVMAGKVESFEQEYACHGPNRRRWFVARVTRFDSAEGPRVVVAHEDITPRKQAELALRDSEARFRAWAETSSDLICRHHPDGRYAFVSAAARTILGYEPQELVGRNPYDLFHPDDVDVIRRSHRRVLELAYTDTVTYRLRHKSGGFVWVETTSRALRDDETNAVIEIHTDTRDVTARRLAEVNLRRAQAAIDQVSDAVVITTPQLELPGPQIVYVNPAFERITGYRADEVMGRTPRLLQGPRTDRATLDRLKQTLRAGQTFRGRTVNYRKDRAEYIADWVVTPVRDESGPVIYYVSIQRDVTAQVSAAEEARRREVELAHVGRLSMMGELASGLAHELNQPLAAIANYTKGCLRRMQAEDWDRAALVDAIGRAAEQADRAGQIMRRMRQFVRKREQRVGPARLTDLLADALALLEHESRRAGVAVQTLAPDDLPPVCVDETQTVQVLVNLIRNAIEAMEATPAAQRRLRLSARTAPGDYVELKVIDAGPPVSDEQARRMFEPFFTTKAEGMGMGLPISRTLVENQGGKLTAEPNAPDGGMTFTLTFPASRPG